MSKILQTPIINAITPFDPSLEYIINFTYLDNQIVKNRAIITDNESGNIIYDQIQTTMRLQHIIPANTLVAGNKYLIQIQVYDVDENKSNLSEPVLFCPLSTPIFEFGNIRDGDVYKNASITLTLNYQQLEEETIKSFQFFMYGSDKSIITSSDILYSSSSLLYTFYGLNNNTTYYFRAIGETNHGITLDTDYIEVNILFNTIPFDAIFQVENNYNEGYITLNSNIVVVSYELENENYTIDNGFLDIKNNNLTYKDFKVSADEDFSLFLEVKQIPLTDFLKLNNICLSAVRICDLYYCRLTIRDSDFVQFIPIENVLLIDEKYIKTNDSNNIGIIIRKVEGYYGLEIYYK